MAVYTVTQNRTLSMGYSVLALPTLKVRLAQRPAQKGAPTALVITSAALRAADLARVLRDMRGAKGGDVAKLFAKHFKLEEHAEYLRRTLVSAGVGTPGRLGRLLSETGMFFHAFHFYLCPDKITSRLGLVKGPHTYNSGRDFPRRQEPVLIRHPRDEGPSI